MWDGQGHALHAWLGSWLHAHPQTGALRKAGVLIRGSSHAEFQTGRLVLASSSKACFGSGRTPKIPDGRAGAALTPR